MATGLYKRYIPPSAGAPQQSSCRPIAPPAASPELKRKRERTQDEVADRKAKKLKKKGGDPAHNIVVKTAAPVESPVNEVLPEVVEDGGPKFEAKGEFGHIKSGKKRHKLEKEARKAKKAAKEQGDGASEVEENAQPVQPADNAAFEPPPRPKKRRKTPEEAPIEDTHARATTPLISPPVDVSRDDGQEEKFEVRHQSPDGETVASVGEANGTTDQVSEQSVVPPKLKKRRHKLESVLAGAQDDQPAEESQTPDQAEEDQNQLNERQRKHNGVLSKYQKSLQISSQRPADVQEVERNEENVVHELSLPEKAATPEVQPETETLPPWLANPTVLASDHKATFASLALAEPTVSLLSKLGFDDALPVQQAIIPLLLPPGIPGAQFLPGTESVLPDLAVSAPTGSGKTVAYLLPMIEALRQPCASGRLGALVVVPTRELVAQVAAVAESLAKGSGIKVDTATGSGRFKDEQDRLVARGRQYDPEGYERLMAQADRSINPLAKEWDEVDDGEGLEDAKTVQHLQNAVRCLVDHIPTYTSACDILIATPGRLQEHLAHTVGFSLASLQWLVMDEADKLLDNQNESFLEEIITAVESSPRTETLTKVEKLLFHAQRRKRVRKIVLSATMTRDISKLASLHLAWPQMVVVRGSEPKDDMVGPAALGSEGLAIKQTADGFELPRTLAEYCVPVGDGSEKPLIATEVLRRITKLETDVGPIAKARDDGDDDEDEDDESDVSSIVSDSSSEVSSIVSSDSEDDSDPETASREASPPPTRFTTTSRPPTASSTASSAPTILLFTSSTQSATRLSHLLRHLQPTWSRHITTLLRTKTPRLTIAPSAPLIVISTDRAARGLDSLSSRPVTHVLQYDVPTSVEGYVHRVGRTARAGRRGEAWTLYTHGEARWFLREIGGEKGNGEGGVGIGRVGRVERVKIERGSEDVRERLRGVVEGMRGEVARGRR